MRKIIITLPKLHFQQGIIILMKQQKMSTNIRYYQADKKDLTIK